MSVAITGTVRIDLAAVEGVNVDLFVGERAYAVLWRAMTAADSSLRFDLWIGAARRVFWIDPRTFDLLAQASSVCVSGTDPAGVEDAVAGLRQALGERAA